MQKTVSQSRKEAKMLSLGKGLRMEGISALTMWDTIVVVVNRQAGGESKRTKGA